MYHALKKNNVYGRRYFYPLISDLPIYKDFIKSSADYLPVAKKLSSEVICLPIYPELEIEKVEYICEVIKKLAAN